MPQKAEEPFQIYIACYVVIMLSKSFRRTVEKDIQPFHRY